MCQKECTTGMMLMGVHKVLQQTQYGSAEYFQHPVSAECPIRENRIVSRTLFALARMERSQLRPLPQPLPLLLELQGTPTLYLRTEAVQTSRVRMVEFTICCQLRTRTSMPDLLLQTSPCRGSSSMAVSSNPRHGLCEPLGLQ